MSRTQKSNDRQRKASEREREREKKGDIGWGAILRG